VRTDLGNIYGESEKILQCKRQKIDLSSVRCCPLMRASKAGIYKGSIGQWLPADRIFLPILYRKNITISLPTFYFYFFYHF